MSDQRNPGAVAHRQPGPQNAEEAALALSPATAKAKRRA